ncbi:GTP-binding protein [Kibdelosporangium aridum]|uniref:Signal recognition particle receptor subunit beta, a GTPase n=1 Tax=Kibdelosporangium aridum TaxID=2030 RepID=A0A1W1ZX66_KIBAR|nr:ATP/GTP-binding protein [Kibdelosporangium aridum]SMC53059.1 Signal recognition particle receptor subunit beta, a GTPase [Kibdelosporangium aridum]
MVSPTSDVDTAGGEDTIPTPVKIIVAGGFGVGKTTLVGSVSEIPPLTTEELLTEASDGIDDLAGVERKTTTTVALDFGRITISPKHVLYLFGTPGQDRFWFMWDELARGAIGCVVLVDTRRLDNSFAAIDYFERRRIPFIVAVNVFDDAQQYGEDEIRAALAVPTHVPIVMCDARKRDSAKLTLIKLVKHAMSELPVG